MPENAIRDFEMDQATFNALWKTLLAPACPRGMALLKLWADTDPYVVPRLLEDPRMTLARPVSFETTKALAFLLHHDMCEKCQHLLHEVDSAPMEEPSDMAF